MRRKFKPSWAHSPRLWPTPCGCEVLPPATPGFIEMPKGPGKPSSRPVEHSARHPGIQPIQDTFRKTPERMYRWADDRNVPADNNFAERTLRPLVIARKVSFGSHSDAGARTREILMNILFTLKQRFDDFQIRFKNPLDRLAENPNLDPYALLSQQDPSQPAHSRGITASSLFPLTLYSRSRFPFEPKISCPESQQPSRPSAYRPYTPNFLPVRPFQIKTFGLPA
jgi:hypothetical protein